MNIVIAFFFRFILAENGVGATEWEEENLFSSADAVPCISCVADIFTNIYCTSSIFCKCNRTLYTLAALF